MLINTNVNIEELLININVNIEELLTNINVNIGELLILQPYNTKDYKATRNIDKNVKICGVSMVKLYTAKTIKFRKSDLKMKVKIIDDLAGVHKNLCQPSHVCRNVRL